VLAGAGIRRAGLLGAGKRTAVPVLFASGVTLFGREPRRASLAAWYTCAAEGRRAGSAPLAVEFERDASGLVPGTRLALLASRCLVTGGGLLGRSRLADLLLPDGGGGLPAPVPFLLPLLLAPR
jgi:hypothetical protein